VLLVLCTFALFAANSPASWTFFALAEIWFLVSALVGVVLLVMTVVRFVLGHSSAKFAKPS